MPPYAQIHAGTLLRESFMDTLYYIQLVSSEPAFLEPVRECQIFGSEYIIIIIINAIGVIETNWNEKQMGWRERKRGKGQVHQKLNSAAGGGCRRCGADGSQEQQIVWP